MLLLFTLLSCACPTFDEMRVVGKDETATEARLEQVEVGLAWFAQWTGDAGVCVPEIMVEEDIRETRSIREAGFEAAGRYRGPHHPIQIDSDLDDDLLGSTMHELCHANDHLEGHSTAMTFPSSAFVDVIEEDLANGEAFAGVCEQGPSNTTLDTTLSAMCGTAAYYDDVDRYLSEVVYQDYPYPNIRHEFTPISRVWHSWTGIGDEADVQDATVVGDEVAMLISETAADGESADLSVRFFDAELEPTGHEIPLAEGASARYGRFVPSDEGLYVQLEIIDEGVRLPETLFEIGSGAATNLPLSDLESVNFAAISGGILYGSQDRDFVAWNLDGTPVELSDHVLELGWSTFAWVMWPEPGGFAFYASEGLGRYNAAAQTWSIEGAPAFVDARFPLGDGRAVVRAPWSGARILLYEDGAYSFLGDPCDSDLGRAWAYASVVSVGGRLWSIGEEWYSEESPDVGAAHYVQEIVVE